jgi:putative transcriptional regulator
MTPEDILSVRKALGLTQADFARLFDAHVMTISKWERGVAVPSPYQVALMGHFKRTADARKEQGQKELQNLLVGAGVVAALIWLLSNAKH